MKYETKKDRVTPYCFLNNEEGSKFAKYIRQGIFDEVRGVCFI